MGNKKKKKKKKKKTKNLKNAKIVICCKLESKKDFAARNVPKEKKHMEENACKFIKMTRIGNKKLKKQNSKKLLKKNKKKKEKLKKLKKNLKKKQQNEFVLIE